MAAGPSATLTLLLCVVGCGALDVWTSAGSRHPAPSVNCWCSSYPNQTFCSWTEAPGSQAPRYVATYSERLRPSEVKPCQPMTPDPSSPSLRLCHLPDLKLLTDYIVNVTAVHADGSSSHLRSFMVEEIVNPDPPASVRVSTQDGAGVLVEWAAPPTWASLDIFRLKYEMIYSWRHQGQTWTTREGPFPSTQAVLKDLPPGRTYHFQVCAKELLDLGHCSSWTSPVQVTIPKI